MHIPDGYLPTAVCAAGYAIAVPVTAFALYKIRKEGDPREKIPKASLLTAAFFVASWIHIPVPPTSVHLILSGLMGSILGYFAFPAILIGLFLQAVMFGHGGLSTLGVNAIVIGLPALVAYHIFRLRTLFGEANRTGTGIFGFLASLCAIGISTGLFVVLLINFIPADMDADDERNAILALALGHVPLMFIEGAFTAFVTMFLLRVRPQMLIGI
ncbi:MAG: cobalt transporter CbiM [Chloroflexi bacterium]|nr:cobalt transporter CbiM [Chloroflexota bacterium]